MSDVSRLRHINEEKRKHLLWQGVFVSLDILEFPFSRALDQTHVERLTKAFSGGRCLPEREDYRIPAIASKDAFEASWFEDIDGSIYLKPPANFKLRCLRGQHRARAAQNLVPGRQHWVVDIYDSAISHDAQVDFIEKYDGEKPPDDGEFYYKARLYAGAFGVDHADMNLERRWKARWNSLPKRRSPGDRNSDDLERLLGHQRYVIVLDSLHHLKALYSGLRLGSIGKMISLGCEEEVLGELRRLQSFWYKVFEGNETFMNHFDSNSLGKLQRTAPGACARQKAKLESEIIAGEILPSLILEDRLRVFQNFCAATRDTIAPSLDTFFGNLNYREVLRSCMARLIDPLCSRNESLRSIFSESFVSPAGPSHCFIQVDSDHLVRIRTEDDPFDISYRQLWLFALRHCDSLPPVLRPRKAGPSGDPAHKRVLYEFARLAYEIGFRTTRINELLGKDPDREIARHMLQMARDSRRYTYPDLELAISHVAAAFRNAVHKLDVEPVDPPDGNRAANLCGKPRVEHFEGDKNFMFLHRLHGPAPQQGNRPSSFFIARSHYFSFLGDDLKTDFSEVEQLDRIAIYNREVSSAGIAEGLLQDQNSASEAAKEELIAREARLQEEERRLNGRERDLQEAQAALSQHVSQLDQTREEQLQDSVAKKLEEARHHQDETLRNYQARIQEQEQQLERARLLLQQQEQCAKQIEDLEAQRKVIEQGQQTKDRLELEIADLERYKQELMEELQLLSQEVEAKKTSQSHFPGLAEVDSQAGKPEAEENNFQSVGQETEYIPQPIQPQTRLDPLFLSDDSESEGAFIGPLDGNGSYESVSDILQFVRQDGSPLAEFPLDDHESIRRYAAEARDRACTLWYQDPEGGPAKRVQGDYCFELARPGFPCVIIIADGDLDTRELPGRSVIGKRKLTAPEDDSYGRDHRGWALVKHNSIHPTRPVEINPKVDDDVLRPVKKPRREEPDRSEQDRTVGEGGLHKTTVGICLVFRVDLAGRVLSRELDGRGELRQGREVVGPHDRSTSAVEQESLPSHPEEADKDVATYLGDVKDLIGEASTIYLE
ncbi:hypothetical protein HIM_12405 [Hirsutella minnesotensis 3608]|uniref:Uncharacterized protein n=1 Tax=Hirsutella minnesotensis 3608 TaxID=1043627 RepID=A0A0F8A055_9HYPO|nr:hypothetical protein HIM_12405 [Hirsutella minnesotensis 3608]